MNTGRWLHTLGLPGFIGLVLLAVSGWAWQDWLPALRQDVVHAEERAADARARLQSAASRQTGRAAVNASAPPQPVSLDPQQAWQAWWSRLPAAEQSTPLQAEVLAQAARHGLAVQSVQYRGAALAALPQVWRQQVTLPVEGSPVALRGWLAALLMQPAVSVDSLDISRDSAMAGQVKARVGLSVWWRRAP